MNFPSFLVILRNCVQWLSILMPKSLPKTVDSHDLRFTVISSKK